MTGKTTAIDPGWKAAGDSGHDHGAVNFDELVDHYFAAFPARRREGESDRTVEAREEGFRKMLAAFESEEGRVKSQTWCPHIECGVILTEKPLGTGVGQFLSGDQVRYFAGGNPVETDEDLRLGQLMAQTDQQAQRVADLLRNPMRRNALRQLYEVRATALEGFEALAKRRLSGDEATRLRSVVEKQVSQELKSAVAYAERAMRMRAALLYLMGMASGVIALMVVAGILLFFFGRKEALIDGTDFMPTALVLGGLGAVISVLQRMTNNQLSTSLENGQAAVFLLGVFRPLIGAVLAFAIIVLILGGIIPLDVPADATRAVFFLSGIAFLAGFSERYAQSLLGAAKTGATPVDASTTTTTTTTTDTDTSTVDGTTGSSSTSTATDTSTDTSTTANGNGNGSGSASTGSDAVKSTETIADGTDGGGKKGAGKQK